MFDIDSLIIDNIQVNCGSQYNNKVDIPNIQSVDVTSGISQPPLSHALYHPEVSSPCGSGSRQIAQTHRQKHKQTDGHRDL